MPITIYILICNVLFLSFLNWSSKKEAGDDPNAAIKSNSDDLSSAEPANKCIRTGKQYACTHCSYSADKKVSLNRHMRMHQTSPAPSSVTSNGDDCSSQVNIPHCCCYHGHRKHFINYIYSIYCPSNYYAIWCACMETDKLKILLYTFYHNQCNSCCFSCNSRFIRSIDIVPIVTSGFPAQKHIEHTRCIIAVLAIAMGESQYIRVLKYHIKFHLLSVVTFVLTFSIFNCDYSLSRSCNSQCNTGCSHCTSCKTS